ncbi:UNVERIFIED_CONTAM: hypothetical protein Slati_2771200 [Sesamum latifolium]|uniref:Uncharacterized protein n=1 Tax=Sesamum latifolium TaxID=2727402 RepID=A0AAW2VZB6_9LAMI
MCSSMAWPAKSLCMAELGCSSGPHLRRRNSSAKHGHDQLPEFQIQLNDLPGNHFNSIFKSFAPSFHARLLQELGSSAPYYFYPEFLAPFMAGFLQQNICSFLQPHVALQVNK